MYKIAYTFANQRQTSVQEAAFLCIPELWLRKFFLSILYFNTNTPLETLRMLKSEIEIAEFPENSNEIFKFVL